MNRIIVNECPSSIVRLSGDEYVYNYDIQKIDDEHYSYISVSLRGYPNYKDCVKEIIRQYYTQDEEFDLINTHNYNILNNEDDSEYINYLNLLKEIKTKIKADFE